MATLFRNFVRVKENLPIEIFKMKYKKQIIVLFFICYFLPFCLTQIFLGFTFGYCFMFEICKVFALNFLILLPAFILLYFIFIHTKSIKIRRLSAIFIIPLWLCILSKIHDFLFLPISSIFSIAEFSVLVFMPFIILVILGFPYRFIDVDDKIEMLKSFIFMYIVFIILFILCCAIDVKPQSYFAPIERYKLQKYEKTLSSIEEFKAKNGKFPQSLTNEVPSIFKYYKYESLNDGQNFILYLSDDKYLLKEYFVVTEPAFVYYSDSNNIELKDRITIGKWHVILPYVD